MTDEKIRPAIAFQDVTTAEKNIADYLARQAIEDGKYPSKIARDNTAIKPR